MVFTTLALVGGAAPVYAAGAQEPIAVMPFKNVNRASDIAWLEVGVAETMVSDLRRAGQKVVERDQLNLALTEIALQQEAGSDASNAARVGKMVGAKTVVVGGFQRANDRLRITARFVDVETGEIRDTAKVTGALTEIFSLQDQIVERLIGRAPPSRKKRKRGAKGRRGTKASTTKAADKKKIANANAKSKAAEVATANPDVVVQAYRAYAESLETTSPAKRVTLLREAIALDPDFIYAVDDLAALEERLAALRKKDAALRSERAAQLMPKILDAKLDWQTRRQHAFELITAHMTGFHYRALLEDARLIYRLDWPADPSVDVREYASFSIVNAHQQLKHGDLVLQAGERHLKEFAGGRYSMAVDSMMQRIIDQRRDRKEKREGLAAKLEKIEADRAKDLERTTRRKRWSFEKKRARIAQINRVKDYARCTAAWSTHWREAIVDACGDFVSNYAEDIEADENRLNARWIIAQAYADDGDFDRARDMVDRLEADAPKWAAKRRLGMVRRTWPR